MNSVQTGMTGSLYSASLIVILLAAMLFMSLRLFLNRRKKAYFSLSVSLFFVIAQYLTVIVFESTAHGNGQAYAYVSSLFKMISFVLMNLGVYQLYNPSKKRHFALFYGAALVGFVISFAGWPASGPVQVQDGIPASPRPNLALELYMYALAAMFFLRVSPRIGQSGKYEFGLILFFLMQTADLLNAYAFGGNQKVLSAISGFFPVPYYFILFMILFERVVELMQAIYATSIKDTLTGLYNRRYLTMQLHQYMHAGIPVSAIFTDIDNFKKLNDTEGHQKGDDALKQVARILLEESEHIGLAGRYGGEEMVVLLTDPDEDASELAERIRRRVEAEAGVTVSVGLSRSRKSATPETLLKQADEAMYAAKRTGKNKVVKYSSRQQTLQP